jgi:hypothetical protein
MEDGAPSHVGGRPRRWSVVLPAVALVIWLGTPTLSAIAMRPAPNAGRPPASNGTHPSAPTTPTVPNTPTPTVPITTTPTVPTPTVPTTSIPTTSTIPTVQPSQQTPPGSSTPVTSAPAAPSTTPTTAGHPGALASPPASPARSVQGGLPATTPTTTTSSVDAATATDRCKPDPAPAIAALPPGGTFRGTGCYVTNGILITKPVVIDGGVYHDHVDTNSGDGTVHPIIRVKDTMDVTIRNVALIGANNEGGFHPQLVGQAGFDILSSDNVSILNVSVKNTFGDGLTAFANFGKDNRPTSGLVVDGLSITNAGREGITMGYAIDSTLNRITVNSAFGDGWDFESDLPGIGSGNILVSDSRSTKGVRLIEALHGPVTFENCRCQRHVTVMDEAAASGQAVTFNGGSVLLPNGTDKGGGITVRGPGRLYFNCPALGSGMVGHRRRVSGPARLSGDRAAGVQRPELDRGDEQLGSASQGCLRPSMVSVRPIRHPVGAMTDDRRIRHRIERGHELTDGLRELDEQSSGGPVVSGVDQGDEHGTVADGDGTHLGLGSHLGRQVQRHRAGSVVPGDATNTGRVQGGGHTVGAVSEIVQKHPGLSLQLSQPAHEGLTRRPL